MKTSTKLFLLGIAMILFGGAVLGNAALASLAVVALTGGLLLVGGGLQVFAGFTMNATGGKVFAWGMGILMMLLGWSFLANPLEGVISLSTLILILLALGGALRILFAWRLRASQFFWPLLLTGTLSVVLAFYILSSPEATMLFLGVLLGIEMIFNGLGVIFFGLHLRQGER